MNRTEAIFILNQFETECRKAHLDTEADAVALAIYTMGTVDTLKKERDAAMAQQTCGDTISRQAAIDAVLDLNAEHRVSWKDAVIDLIDEMPSTQPECKKGKWTGSHGIYCDRAWCSNCLSAFPIDPNHPFKTPMDWKYCPDCGAKMEVEHE